MTRKSSLYIHVYRNIRKSGFQPKNFSICKNETFADRVISFNEKLKLEERLPGNIRAMNPFAGNPAALTTSSAFYRKYYNDNRKRHLLLGINPGRFGAGVTGIPFTDTKRLEEKCGLGITGLKTHEPSSVFVYEVIDAYGGVCKFFRDFYINSPSPLGFVKKTEDGRELNFNYYDSRELQDALEGFMARCIKEHIALGIYTDTALCLGSGKNFRYLSSLNEKHRFFKKIVPLEHPRYIMQYRSRDKEYFISKYLSALAGLRDNIIRS